MRTGSKQALDIAAILLEIINRQFSNFSQQLKIEKIIQRVITSTHTRIFAKDNILKEQITKKEQKEWLELLTLIQQFFRNQKAEKLAQHVELLKTLSGKAIDIINKNAPLKQDKNDLSTIQEQLAQATVATKGLEETFKKNPTDQNVKIALSLTGNIEGIFRAIEKKLK